MNNAINLKSLDKKAFLSTFEDGFWEIWFGLFLIGSSISSFFPDNDLVRIINTVIVALLIPFLVFWLGKKYITIPRLGLVKFGQKRKAKRIGLGFVILALNIPVFLLWIYSTTQQIPPGLGNWLNTYYGSPVAFSLLILIFFISGANITGLKRLYTYGILIALSMFFFELSYVNNGSLLEHFLPYCISGFIILVVGLIYLRKFLKRYPRTLLDNIHESQ